VVALETITNAELEIVVKEALKPGKLLVGTSTELGSTSSTVVGPSVEVVDTLDVEVVDSLDVEVVETLDVVLLAAAEGAALDEDVCEVVGAALLEVEEEIVDVKVKDVAVDV